MSEEEVIDIINQLLPECNNDIDGEISLKCNGLTRKAIQSLLELYNDEKEKNKKY